MYVYYIYTYNNNIFISFITRIYICKMLILRKFNFFFIMIWMMKNYLDKYFTPKNLQKNLEKIRFFLIFYTHVVHLYSKTFTFILHSHNLWSGSDFHKYKKCYIKLYPFLYLYKVCILLFNYYFIIDFRIWQRKLIRD